MKGENWSLQEKLLSKGLAVLGLNYCANCFCINKQTLENFYHKMYQFQSLIYPLNSNVTMHAPANLSSLLVEWILSLDISF